MDSLNKKTILEYDMAGNGIVLDTFDSISGFVQSGLGKSFRKNLKRSIERFEHCYDVKYKMYFGEIDKETYISLMDNLREMYLLRFEQLGKTNVTVFTWSSYYDNCYNLINSKQASLFVIYANNKPVDISLAFHYDKLFFSVVSSYDLDYSKFSLGHISIYKEVEWCLQNEYMLYDLSYGADMPYKEKWTNLDYVFENHILYKKGSLKGFLGFLFSLGYATLKNTLYRYSKLYLLYDKFKQRKIISDSLENINYVPYDYHKETIDPSSVTGLLAFELKDEELKRLQKPINDFLYANRLKKSELKILKQSETEEEYYLISPSQIEKISFK